MSFISVTSEWPQKDILRRAFSTRNKSLAVPEEENVALQSKASFLSRMLQQVRAKSNFFLDRLHESNIEINKTRTSCIDELQVVQNENKTLKDKVDQLICHRNTATERVSQLKAEKQSLERKMEVLSSTTEAEDEKNYQEREKLVDLGKTLECENSRLRKKLENCDSMWKLIRQKTEYLRRLNQLLHEENENLIAKEAEESIKCENSMRRISELEEQLNLTEAFIAENQSDLHLKDLELMQKDREIAMLQQRMEHDRLDYDRHLSEVQNHESGNSSPSILNGHWIVLSKLGSGSSGDVFKAVLVKDAPVAAIKSERKRNGCISSLQNEVAIYRTIQQKCQVAQVQLQVPRVYESFSIGDKEFMAMQILGPSLEDLMMSCGGKFSPQCILSVGLQAISCLEQVHSCGFIHRDVKPANFMVDAEYTGKIYIADFGLSVMRNADDTKKNFAPPTELCFQGTPVFASRKALLRQEHTRRDDLEALWYSLVWMMKGELPFFATDGESFEDMVDQILAMKVYCNHENLCCEVPQLVQYFEYIDKLEDFENPNYEYLRSLMLGGLGRSGVGFDWS